jgi:DNA-directed RNA polymerase II subunit RPB7
MIPPSLKYSAEGSTPAFTDHAEQIVERGAQVRLRIKGIRGEIGSMYAIGTIYEDYLG